MHRIGRVVLAMSLLTVIPLPVLMKSCGGGGMGHMEAGTGARTARIEGGFGLSPASSAQSTNRSAAQHAQT
jgi:hypothetical protein